MPEYLEYTENNKNGKHDKDEDYDKSYESNKEEEQFKQELIKVSSLRFYTYLYLKNSDQSKYNGVMKTLNQQKSPNTIIETSEILSNHLNESNFNLRNQSHANNNVNNNDSVEANMKIQTTPTLSFAQLETRCYCCGRKGQKSPQCKHQNTIPKSERTITKT